MNYGPVHRLRRPRGGGLMGTLEEVRRSLLLVHRLPHGDFRKREAAVAAGAAWRYLRELERRNAAYAERHGGGIPGLGGHRILPHDDELAEARTLLHRLVLLGPAVDPEARWRGWTVDQQRVTVIRRGQMAIGRRGRARVEDAYVVRIGDAELGPWPQDVAMKQARWATMVRDGKLPEMEIARGRRRRQLLFLAQRKKRANPPRFGCPGGRQ